MLNNCLDEFINYLATVKNYSHRTLPSYRSSLQLFFDKQAIKLPTEITVVKTEKYLSYRIGQGKSQNTNATFMNALRAFLIFCNKRGYANAQIDMFEVPKRKRTRLEFVTAEEVNRMVEVTRRERDRLILLVLYTSGCRVSELIQMEAQHIKDNSFTVIAKGGKPHVYYFDYNVSERLRIFMQMEGIVTGPVFCMTTGRPIGTPAITHLVRKAAKAANISHNVHPHQFRHGFATASLEAGADIRTIQEMMGHENIQTTMRYAHVTDARMKQTHQQFAPKVMAPDFFSRQHTPVNKARA